MEKSKDKEFTVLWDTGFKEKVKGADYVDALRKKGYSLTHMYHITYWYEGDRMNDFNFSLNTRSWNIQKIKKQETGITNPFDYDPTIKGGDHA